MLLLYCVQYRGHPVCGGMEYYNAAVPCIIVIDNVA